MNNDVFTEIIHSGGDGLVFPPWPFQLGKFQVDLGTCCICLTEKKKPIYGIILILSGHLLDCSQIANE